MVKHDYNSQNDYEILHNRHIISITGNDATNFLQKIITNDINNADNIYTLSLNFQGRYLFDFFVSKIDDGYFIDCFTELQDSLIKFFQLYKLRSEFDITTTNYKVVYSKSQINFNYIVQYKDPRYRNLGWRSIIDEAQANQLLQSSKKDIYLNDKYKYIIPEGEYELIKGKSIAIEYGIDLLNGISYSKGCYMGQELISRTKNLGVVRKQVYGGIIISNFNDAIEKGSEVFTIDKEKLGIICSCYGNNCILLLNTEKIEKKFEKDFKGDLKEAVIDINILNTQLKLKLLIPSWR